MTTRAEAEDLMRQAMSQGNNDMARAILTRIDAGEFDAPEQKSSAVGAALQGIGQGGTFGFADELGAGYRTMLDNTVLPGLAGLQNRLQGGEFSQGFSDYVDNYGAGEQGILGNYQQNLESQREALGAAREDHGGITMGAELGAGLAGGLVGGAKVAAANTGRQALARGIGGGAAYGGLAGAGYSEAGDVEGVLTDTAQGAAIGGSLGALAPAAGMVGRTVLDTMRKTFGPNAAHNRAVSDVYKAVTKDLKSYEGSDSIQSISVDDFQQILKDNPNMLMADVGPNTQRLMKELVAQGGEHGNAIKQFLTKTRAGSAQKRILQDLKEGLGIKGHDYLQSVQKATEAMRDRAKAGYDKVHQQRVVVTPQMRKILTETELGKKAQRRVSKLSAGEYDMQVIDDNVQSVSGRQMDYLMRAMDSEVNKAWKRKGDQYAGEQFGKVRDKFRTAIEARMPGYRKVRDQYRSDRDDLEAFELGQRLLKDDLDVTAAEMRGMSETGKQFFKIGVAQGVKTAVKAGQSTGDVADKFLSRPQLKDALRLAFGNERKFKQFVKRLDVESRQADSAKIARSASPTDAPQVPHELIGAGGVFLGSQAAKVAGSNPLLMAGAGRRIANRMAPESSALQNTYEQMSPLLLSRSVDDIMPRGGLLSPAYSGVGLSPAAGLMGGLMSTDQ